MLVLSFQRPFSTTASRAARDVLCVCVCVCPCHERLNSFFDSNELVSTKGEACLAESSLEKEGVIV